MMVKSSISSAVKPTEEATELPGHEFDSMTPALKDTWIGLLGTLPDPPPNTPRTRWKDDIGDPVL
jgi:hypothetical protein